MCHCHCHIVIVIVHDVCQHPFPQLDSCRQSCGQPVTLHRLWQHKKNTMQVVVGRPLADDFYHVQEICNPLTNLDAEMRLSSCDRPLPFSCFSNHHSSSYLPVQGFFFCLSVQPTCSCLCILFELVRFLRYVSFAAFLPGCSATLSFLGCLPFAEEHLLHFHFLLLCFNSFFCRHSPSLQLPPRTSFCCSLFFRFHFQCTRTGWNFLCHPKEDSLKNTSWLRPSRFRSQDSSQFFFWLIPEFIFLCSLWDSSDCRAYSMLRALVYCSRGCFDDCGRILLHLHWCPFPRSPFPHFPRSNYPPHLASLLFHLCLCFVVRHFFS